VRASWFSRGTAIVITAASLGLSSAQTAEPAGITAARQALAAKHFARAKSLFAAYAHAHAGSAQTEDLQAQLGLGDAELGLHEYQAAELQYRRVVAVQPELWLAHKNLVVVEAALGRWDEFDRERALLRAARRRGAPGISARESDVIDSFDLPGKPALPGKQAAPAQHWIVRAYDEPAGRSLTRYNFERFGPDGRVQEYVSLESAEAAQRALDRSDVRIGADPPAPAKVDDYALNFYTGQSHGTIALYPQGEPSYERVRADVMRWLRR
jgi:tetratricopeptide (TPR) repeat protein